MGMFDEILCEWPLPDPEVQDHVFQTKDLLNMLDRYTITKEGRLIWHRTRLENVPEEERPYWGTPDWESPIMRLAGMYRSVPVGDVDLNHHGYLDFYTSRGKPDTEGDSDYQWYGYRAKFTDGVVVSIERVERGHG